MTFEGANNHIVGLQKNGHETARLWSEPIEASSFFNNIVCHSLNNITQLEMSDGFSRTSSYWTRDPYCYENEEAADPKSVRTPRAHVRALIKTPDTEESTIKWGFSVMLA